MVTLPVELTCAGKFMPSLEMVGNGLVGQSALSKSLVVEFGFCTGLPGPSEKRCLCFVQRNVIVVREQAR